VVLTGGPGAGKTAVLETIRQHFCEHVRVLPESASIVFGGGFPRLVTLAGRRAAQRAIYRVQRELERMVSEEEGASLVVCDRGTVDGVAYWPAETSTSLFGEVGTTLAEQVRRYDAVIHLRVPRERNGYGHSNPLRVESPHEAARIDGLIADAWHGHPRRFVVESTDHFMTKVERALALIRAEIPECCRGPGLALPQRTSERSAEEGRP
jgi:predicted ATPase